MSEMLVRSKDQVAVSTAWYDASCPLNPGALVPRSLKKPPMAGVSASRCASACFRAALVDAAAAATDGSAEIAPWKKSSSGSGWRSSDSGTTLETSGETPEAD